MIQISDIFNHQIIQYTISQYKCIQHYTIINVSIYVNEVGFLVDVFISILEKSN